jgi:hypothetical protein
MAHNLRADLLKHTYWRSGIDLGGFHRCKIVYIGIYGDPEKDGISLILIGRP